MAPRAADGQAALRLIPHADADAFLRDAREELEQREVEHGLILGVALGLRQAPPPSGTPPYLATVRDQAGLVVAALMTPPAPLLLASDREEAGESMEVLAEHLLASGRAPAGVVTFPALAEAFAESWARASGCSARLGMLQRLYALTELRPVPRAPGRLRVAAPPELELVARWMAAFDAETMGEESPPEWARATAERRIAAREIYLWEDSEPRTMAARARPTARGVAVNAVYTPPEWRGQGLATTCVASLTELLLREGREFCALFTDLANPTSNAIYERIGYRPVRDFALYRFHGQPG